MKDKKDKSDVIKGAIIIFIFILIFIGIGFGIYHDVKDNKQYGEIRYEFVITDMYDDIGSNWHLIGGRASEQEYHVVYKYRLTNRPDDDRNMKWYIGETTVSGSCYRKLHIGQTLYKNSQIFPHSY